MKQVFFLWQMILHLFYIPLLYSLEQIPTADQLVPASTQTTGVSQAEPTQAINIQPTVQQPEATVTMPAAPISTPAVTTEASNEQVETKKKEEEERLGIDTVDIEEGGNWLLKRKALEDTVDIIEHINRLFTKILETRMEYQIKRNQLDAEYDVFAATIGFDLGDIDELLASILDRLEKERKEEGDLSPEERTLLEEAAENKKTIEQLQNDLKTLNELEKSIDKVLMTVENQINISNEHQNQAWRNFQLIKKILSDETAEELYYNTESLYKSLQEIYNYLTNNLPQYFNEQIQGVRDQMSLVKTAVKTLHNKGIDLQRESEQVEEREKELEKKRFEETTKIEIEQALKKAAKDEQKSWFVKFWLSIKQFFISIGNFIYSVIQGIKGLFISPSAETPAQPTEIATQPLTS